MADEEDVNVCCRAAAITAAIAASRIIRLRRPSPVWTGLHFSQTSLARRSAFCSTTNVFLVRRFGKSFNMLFSLSMLLLSIHFVKFHFSASVNGTLAKRLRTL